MNKRILFTVLVFIFVSLDMLSTALAMSIGGVREASGLIYVFLTNGNFALIGWVVFVTLLVYFLYPNAKKYDFETQMDVLLMLYILASINAMFGNFYIYFTHSPMGVFLSG